MSEFIVESVHPEVLEKEGVNDIASPEVESAEQMIQRQVRTVLGDAGEYIGRELTFVDAITHEDYFGITPASVYFRYRDRYIHFGFSNLNVTEEEMSEPSAMFNKVTISFMGEQAYQKEKARRDAILRGEDVSSQAPHTEWATEELNSPHSLAFSRIMVRMLSKVHPTINVQVDPSDKDRYDFYMKVKDTRIEPFRSAIAARKGLRFTPIRISQPPDVQEKITAA